MVSLRHLLSDTTEGIIPRPEPMDAFDPAYLKISRGWLGDDEIVSTMHYDGKFLGQLLGESSLHSWGHRNMEQNDLVVAEAAKKLFYQKDHPQKGALPLNPSSGAQQYQKLTQDIRDMKKGGAALDFETMRMVNYIGKKAVEVAEDLGLSSTEQLDLPVPEYSLNATPTA
jgi:hypothetical protein